MNQYRFKVNTFTEVNAFVGIVSKYDGKAYVLSDPYVINAKSIMGVYSLDLSKKLTLELKEMAPADIEKLVTEMNNVGIKLTPVGNLN